jgi:hypothetical protein
VAAEMSGPDKQWQKRTALSKIATLRKELQQQARPISEEYLAKVGAQYVGAKTGEVLNWMRGQ